MLAALSGSEMWVLFGALAAYLVAVTMFQLWMIKTSSPSWAQRWVGVMILVAAFLLVVWTIVGFRD